MKMVFFSRDRLEVERVSQALTGAHIPCEIRKGLAGNAAEAEVWVKKDGDLSRAFLICVEGGLGFAKRQAQVSAVDIHDPAVAA